MVKLSVVYEIYKISFSDISNIVGIYYSGSTSYLGSYTNRATYEVNDIDVEKVFGKLIEENGVLSVDVVRKPEAILKKPLKGQTMDITFQCVSHDAANNLIHYLPCYTSPSMECYEDGTVQIKVKGVGPKDATNFKTWYQAKCPGVAVLEWRYSESKEEPAKTSLQNALDFLDDVKKTLQEKNKAYGDSAANPLRIFSKSDKDEAIKVRIDDKLSRIAKGDGSGNEDAIKDLVGYLALLAGMRK